MLEITPSHKSHYAPSFLSSALSFLAAKTHSECMQRCCNNLQAKNGDLGDVKVLVPQHPMHVVEGTTEISIVVQRKVLLGHLYDEPLHS